MAVAHDAATESATFTTTSPHTFDHTPVGTPRGVIVGIGHNSTNTVHITSVSYGGVAMEKVGTAFDAETELGRVYLYFLGEDVPTGTSTVSIVHDGAVTTKHAAVATVTAATDTEIGAGSGLGNAFGTSNTPATRLGNGYHSGLGYCYAYTGGAAVDTTSMPLLTGMTAMHEHDFGSSGVRFDRQTDPATGEFAIGYTGPSDDVGFAAVSVIEKTSGARCVGAAMGHLTDRTSAVVLMTNGQLNGADMYCFAISHDSTAGSANVTCTDTSGVGAWAQATGTADSDKKLWTWWKRGTAADVGSSITIGAAVGSVQAGVIYIKGADGANGDPTANASLESNVTGNETHATMDPTSDNAVVVFAIGDYVNDTNAVTTIAGATMGSLEPEFFERLSTGGSDVRLTVTARTLASGATGTMSWAQTNSTTKTVLFAVDPIATAAGSSAPSVIARSFTVDAATPRGSAKAVVAATARSFTVDAVVIHGGGRVLPAATARVFAMDAVTIDDGAQDATVTPDPIATAVSVLANAVVGPAVVQLAVGNYAIVLPPPTPRSPTSVAPAATTGAFTLPLVAVEGEALVETGIDLDIVLPASTQVGPVVQLVSSIDLAAVASQVTIIIGPVAEAQDKFLDRVWTDTDD